MRLHSAYGFAGALALVACSGGDEAEHAEGPCADTAWLQLAEDAGVYAEGACGAPDGLADACETFLVELEAPLPNVVDDERRATVMCQAAADVIRAAADEDSTLTVEVLSLTGCTIDEMSCTSSCPNDQCCYAGCLADLTAEPSCEVPTVRVTAQDRVLKMALDTHLPTILWNMSFMSLWAAVAEAMGLCLWGVDAETPAACDEVVAVAIERTGRANGCVQEQMQASASIMAALPYPAP